MTPPAEWGKTTGVVISHTDSHAKSRTGRAGTPMLADDVYVALRRDIIRGTLRPNEPLVEADIAVRLDVSRTPVRESMQRLADDGLIVSRRRRWYVYEHTRAEVAEIYEARAALEGYAARLAARRASDEALDALREAHDRLEEVADENGATQVEVNDRFHDLIVSAAGNARLATLIERNRLFHFNYRVASSYTPDDIAQWRCEHRRIAEAVCARDADAAEARTREHIEHALALILQRIY